MQSLSPRVLCRVIDKAGFPGRFFKNLRNRLFCLHNPAQSGWRSSTNAQQLTLPPMALAVPLSRFRHESAVAQLFTSSLCYFWPLSLIGTPSFR
jgi:hypothetical protein